MTKAAKITVFVLTLTAIQSFAHSGGTAKDGCHFCFSNCESLGYTTNTRHGHNGETCNTLKGKIDPLYKVTNKQKTEKPSKKAAQSIEKKYSGKVVGIKDGDTIEILLSDSRVITIRLYGVDSPEYKKGQPYNQNAKKFTSEFCFGKTINAEVFDIDRYKRPVAVVKTNDGKNLNQSLVENGLAWVYTKYCKADFCEQWSSLEAKAKAEKMGLWKDKNPIAPWKWRKN